MDLESAVEKIDETGILLVFPIKNQKEPASLWSKFYPRSKMLWEWSDDSDNRVAKLWHLRTELSQSRDVVYAKWYQGRATMFSRPMFTAMLAALRTTSGEQKPFLPESAKIRETLEEDSPQSPRMIREAAYLMGKENSAKFEKVMRDLWARLYIVGFGEIEDGAFPSLAVGLSKLLFEELWEDAEKLSYEKAMLQLTEKLGKKNLFLVYLQRLRKKLISLPQT